MIFLVFYETRKRKVILQLITHFTYTDFYLNFKMKLISQSRLNILSKHKYISLIEYSLEQGDAEFSASDACFETGLSEREFNFIRASIFILNGYQEVPTFDTKKPHQWILRPEAYFSYLQYLEFGHSIEYSRKSYWIAVAAILVAIISVGISI